MLLLFFILQQENSCASSEQSRQVPSLSGHPAAAPFEKGAAVTLQRLGPEEIHQSLLAAIRSGEAAAKLRRVRSFFPLPPVSLNQWQWIYSVYLEITTAVTTSISHDERIL